MTMALCMWGDAAPVMLKCSDKAVFLAEDDIGQLSRAL
jgi:hypothetical protein